MAHVWNVIDGDIYVSKNGDDITGDGSMANPYASINKATTVGVTGNKIIIGTGVWQEARGTSTNKYHFIGDGEVIFNQDDVLFQYNISDTLERFTFKGSYKNIRMSVIAAANVTFIDVKFYNVIFNGGDYRLDTCKFHRCVLIDSYISYVGYNTLNWELNQCLFINMTFGNTMSAGAFLFYFYNSIIYQKTVAQRNYYTMSYNCIFMVDFYATSTVKVSDFLSMLLNCRIADPLFNNPEIGDYTLQPTSPCLFSGKNNTTIGAFGLGYSFDANSSEFTKEGGAVFSQTTLVDDIIRTNQVINGVTRFLFQLASGHASGNVESAWIDLQNIRYLLTTRLFANLIYNAAGVATSRPDNLETAGEKAVFYDFELKYCNEESEKATAAWKNVIWNKAVTIDNTERGNADPAFVASEAQYISARFIKIKLYMTEV